MKLIQRDTRRTFLQQATLGSAALAMWPDPGRAATPERLAWLQHFDPLSPYDPKNYAVVKKVVWRLDTARKLVDELWRTYNETGERKYVDWGFIYWYNYWRLLPLGTPRINAAIVGRKMVENVTNATGRSAWNVFWYAVFIGLESISRGILDAAQLLPRFKNLMDESVKLDPDIYYANAKVGLAKLYLKAPPFPVSIGDADRGWRYIEETEPFQRGEFALWYLFAAEGQHIRGNSKEAIALLGELDEVTPPDIASRIILETTRVDAASLRDVIENNTYDKYKWDPMFTPLDIAID